MRTVIAALTAGAVLWPAAALADAVTLKITDPRDGYEARYEAGWRRTAATAERYWLCDRPLWVPSGVGPKVSRLYQRGYRIELVASGDERAICTLDGADKSVTRQEAPGEAGDAARAK